MMQPPNDMGVNPQGPNQPMNRDREFLLNLIQNTRQPDGPQRGNDLADHPFFSPHEKQRMNQPQQGLVINQRNTPSAPPGFDPQRRAAAEQEMAAARRGQAPPGFFDHDAPLQDASMSLPGLTRRNTSDNINGGQQGPRPSAQSSNLGIPSLPMNDMLWMRAGGHMGVDGRMVAGPPPGLMLPPGHIQQGPPPSSGPPGPMQNLNMRPNGPPMGPPGFPPQGLPMNMRGMPPGPPPGAFGMGPPPPGAFFPPPPGMPMGGPGQPGFFGGRGFPFEEQMRGGGRGF
jgi:hypothetical protein